MPANVGEMFYYGAVPWHGEGLALAKPAIMEETDARRAEALLEGSAQATRVLKLTGKIWTALKRNR